MKIKTKNVLLGVMSCVFAGACAVSVNTLIAEQENTMVSYAEETSILPEESTADFAMMNGASVRYSVGSTGLRFMAYMTESKYTEVKALEDISFGMVIMPYEYVNTYGDVEMNGVLNTNYYWGEEAVAGKTRVLHYSADEIVKSTGRRGAGRYFQCAITNLKAKNYDREFYAKAYYSYTEDGETKYVFTDENETNIRTVEYVSLRALENESNLTDSKSAILSSFAYLGDDGSDKVVDFATGSTGDSIVVEGVGNAGFVGGAAADNGLNLSMSNMKIGASYTLTVKTQPDALDNFKFVISHKKDGEKYDGVDYYTKEKALAEDNGVYTVNFKTAPVDFDEVSLQLVSTEAYSDFTVESMSVEETGNVEITKKPTKNQMVVGSSFDLDAKLNDLNGTIVWKSSNESVATVSKAGRVTTLNAGKTEITATVTVDGKSYEDYFELYVWNAVPSTEKAEPIYEPNAPVDFVLNVPTGREINILQLTDTQTIDYDQIREGVELGGVAGRYDCENASYLNMEGYIDKVMAKLENTPIDLIVLTGDNIYGKFDDKGTKLDELLEKINSLGIYFTFTFGNHDKESDIGIENILRKYANSQYCLYAYNNVTGDSNYSVAIKQGGEYKKVLYMLDTNSTGANQVDDYAYVVQGVYQSQRDWLAETNTAFTDYVGTQNVSAFAFLHIPFTAYVNAIKALELEVGYDVQDTTGTNFGGYYEEFTSAWDNDNSFFSLLKGIGVDGVFVGHQHANSLSLVYEGVRLSYGLKTGTYDAFQYGDLGGTLITLANGGFDVEHVYAVSDHIEDFDLATPMASNHLETSTFWTASMHFDLSTTNNADEMPVNGSGSAMKAVKNETSGWAYLRARMLPLKARQYYTLSFDLSYCGVSQASWDAKINFVGYITPNADVTASQAIYNIPRTIQKDGHFEFTFRAPENTQTSSLYLCFENWANGGLGEYITIDNLGLTETDAPIMTSIVGDDGSFEKDGTTVELYSPYESSLFNQWSKTVSFQYYKDPEGDTSVRVTSDATHVRSQSNMYIKFNQRLVSGQQYTISMDMTWFTESTSLYFSIEYMNDSSSSLQTMYGYEALKYNGTGVFTNETLPLVLNGLTFTAKANATCFYLHLHNNGGDGKTFDFTLDNICVEMCLENIKRYAYSDTITLLSNHDSEITEGNASWGSARSTIMNVVDGKVYVTTSAASGTRNFFFIRFDTPIVKGQFYAITYEAEWLGENTPYNLHYSLDVGEKQAQSLLGYTPKANLFEMNSISFTAKESYDYFYLRIISDETSSTEALDLFDFSITNVALHTGAGSYQYSDTISLHTAMDSTEITDSESRYWNNTSKRISVIETLNGKPLIASYNENANGSSCVYIKFNTAIVAGQSYTITYDAEWLGDGTATGFHYSLEGTDQARGSADGKGYHTSSLNELFVKKSITFTASTNQDYFYLRIINNNANVDFNFTIDNITLTANN